MKKAIGIQVREPQMGDMMLDSRFFGDPIIPDEWAEDFGEDILFFCQIRMSDIAEYDVDNVLPHTGYLYIFLDFSNGSYYIQPIVRYYDGEPNMRLKNYNCDIVESLSNYTYPWIMTFESVDEDAKGMKLLGVPSEWKKEEPAPNLFMQFDPFASEMEFLDWLDGLFCLTFEDNVLEFDKIKGTLNYDFLRRR